MTKKPDKRMRLMEMYDFFFFTHLYFNDKDDYRKSPRPKRRKVEYKIKSVFKIQICPSH